MASTNASDVLFSGVTSGSAKEILMIAVMLDLMVLAIRRGGISIVGEYWFKNINCHWWVDEVWTREGYNGMVVSHPTRGDSTEGASEMN
jgi:hypothetical protein